MLAALDKIAPKKGFWAIDANAAWTPVIALQYLFVLRKYPRIIMVEQPFPIKFPEGIGATDEAAWQGVTEAYKMAKIKIYGDESVATHLDIDRLASYVHGVNVKMDKAGGYRGALTVIDKARTAGLNIWVGMMVGSKLASTAAACLLPAATHGDLDGGLLTSDASQAFLSGGMEWCRTPDGAVAGTVEIPAPAGGHGVTLSVACHDVD